MKERVENSSNNNINHKNHNNQAYDSSVPISFVVSFSSRTLSGRLMADRASGAAWRRRQRRLRSWWRHEQQTVAAVLATVTHHSHSKVGTANAALRGQKHGTSTEVGPAEYFELSSDDGRPTGREERPAALLEPLPREKLQRTQASGTKSSRVSMFLRCRWWNSCRTSLSSLPRVCLWLPSR